MSDELSSIGARFKQRRANKEEAAAEAARNFDYAESLRLRAKILGVLICDARTSAGRTVEDCARMLHLAPETVAAWEFGDDSPSLPQLELLAYYLDVPISHFWGIETREATDHDVSRSQDDYLALRDRVIGTLVQIAREDAGMTQEALADAASLPVEAIAAYELGQASLPMPHLSVIASALRKNVNYFLENGGHLGDWLALREQWKHFTALPDSVRNFAANPLNIGFIEIAILFSQMPADRLRSVGASFLDISG